MTSTIFVTAAVPLLFQSIAVALCNQNQFIAPGVNLCYQFTPDQINLEKVDIQILDMETVQYMHTWWPAPDTMLTQITDMNGCYEWQNNDWNETSTCQ
ncbi:MAG TPA: hypothetical protein VGT08_05100 [Terracidiphilus sp.]|nr:hypothetical protein [Terracidiphilus sp.]